MTLRGSSVAGFVNDRLKIFLEGRAAVLSGCILATVWLVFLLLVHLFVGTELEYTEFFYSFYPAGLLVSAGRSGDLYPGSEDPSFAHTEFNRFVHGMLRHIPPGSRANFLYPPLVAAVFALFALLPLKAALLAWQAVSLAALALSSYLFCLTGSVSCRPARVFFLSFLALTTLSVLFLGQLAIVFGVLPLAAGYFFWHRGRYRLCGLAWAVVSVKPQIFVPLALVAAIQWLVATARRSQDGTGKAAQELILGMAVGLVLIHAVPLLVFGPGAFAGWLRAMKLVITTLADPSSTWGFQLVVSLPALLEFSSPASGPTTGLAWLVSAAFLAAGTWTSLVVITSRSFDADRKLDLLLVQSYLLLPLIAHYVRIYDFAILLVPAWIAVFRNNRQDRAGNLLCGSVVWFFFALNAYLLILFLANKQAVGTAQIILVAVLGLCWLQAVRASLSACQPPPQAGA
jgi:hypothetical protein